MARTGWPTPTAIITLIVLEALVISEGVFAFQDRFLTVDQMQGQGIAHGLPFLWHFAMWSDLVIVSPLASYLVYRAAWQWSLSKFLISIFFGFTTSVLLHWLYRTSTFPEALVNDNQLTNAGIVHLVYMGCTIGIFVQFFIFTEEISVTLLAGTSSLIVLHVFIGTHMLFGFLNLAHRFDWYTAQPLQSPIGIVTFLSVAFGLIWRNISNIDFEAARKTLNHQRDSNPFVSLALDLHEYETLQRADTIERFFKLLDFYAGKVSIGGFLAIITARVGWKNLQNGGALNLENWIAFARDDALPCVLILLICLIYNRSRHSVRWELSIAPKLFSAACTPKKWGGPANRILVTTMVGLFLAFYLLATWFADNIPTVSFLLLSVALIDFGTRYLVGDGLSNFLTNPNYDPLPDDENYKKIEARRNVAMQFLSRPHLAKEAIKASGCAVAFAVATYGYLHSTSKYNVTAYWILIVTLVANEILTFLWRFSASRQLIAIEDARYSQVTARSYKNNTLR